MGKRELLIGGKVLAGPGEPVRLGADVLTTHGVILGMTGSGKTGLAVVMLEELARQRVPLIICDLKGDLTNLLLTFPALAPADFLPFLPVGTPPGERQAAAESVAGRWRQGLAAWGLGSAELAELRQAVCWQLLTPGSGVAPVNLLPALGPPAGYDPDIDPDGARSRLDGTAAGLLALVDRGGDPLSNRDNVLITTLLDAAWRQGRALDLAELIRQIASPPVSQFGVLDAETFYPARERQGLALAFNAVLASPAFAAWTRGVPLAMDALAGTPEAPSATILYLAHLADRERLSFLTLLLSTLLSWVRGQPGSESLRILLYLDEVQGILPPSAMPPTKPPLLTLLKQGRAFGAGVLLATQNPVDLDYKALGNAGLKLLGRLDTENDRRRALEGLDLAGGGAEKVVAGLQPRQFLLAGARVDTPQVITSRWAMSYLRGPLTLAEVKPLVAGLALPAPAAAADPAARAAVDLPGVDELYASAPGLQPAVLVEGRAVYRKAAPAVQREVVASWVAPFSGRRIAWERLAAVELPPLGDRPPEGASLGELPPNAGVLLKEAAREFVRELAARPLETLWHRQLKLVQEEHEDEAAFRARCLEAARAAVGARAEQLRDRYEEKLRKIDDRLVREQMELARDRQDLAARQRQQQLAVATGVGDALLSGLGALLGGRRSGVSTAVRKGASTARQASEKQRMTERAKAEVEESEQAIAALQAERERVLEELQRELAALQSEAERRAGEVERLPLVPATRDVAVRRLALVWLPPDAMR
ncbi:MAG TPA: DUF853 family protein [Thermoanaerobaculaceae bacterium]|nr:DUF853 family protein [Thermoanaerobaculaceae bacterium]HRS16949.1 DUF853 family protein [Thermoanaerobaculaceae bacterium]